MTENPYTADFFKTDLAHSYSSAQRIVPLVQALLSPRSVLDVGCGTGDFLRVFREAGVSDITGIDGDYVPRDQLVIDRSAFKPVDLTQGFDLNRRYDLVLALEVAEHLPHESADRFVGSLSRHADAILFSAAIPYQGGTGHLNEQWPAYWAERFAKLGYAAYDFFRSQLWLDEKVAWWYRQNLILFANAEGPARFPKLASIRPAAPTALARIHPELYLSRIRDLQQANERFNALNKYLSDGTLFEVSRTAEGALNIAKRQ